ncbi:MAG: hemerythrin domain-containing protein [Brevinematales bacterium]|nr:hemerythrin domain-containing protein [Brevinematales bacterium]
MKSHLEEFQKEHAEIKEAIKNVKDKGISTREGRNFLFSMKNMLIEHLKSEDKNLYPVLKQAGLKDKHIRETMELFIKDMDTVLEKVEDFFEKYSADSTGFDFARSFGGLCALLADRINREENILYQEYLSSLKKINEES